MFMIPKMASKVLIVLPYLVISQFINIKHIYQKLSTLISCPQLIMQVDGYHPKTWLAVGAIMHAYCQHDSTCQETPAVKAILARLTSNLGQSCRTNDKDQQQLVVATLKAIGNAGLMSSVDTLQYCFLVSIVLDVYVNV